MPELMFDASKFVLFLVFGPWAVIVSKIIIMLKPTSMYATPSYAKRSDDIMLLIASPKYANQMVKSGMQSILYMHVYYNFSIIWGIILNISIFHILSYPLFDCWAKHSSISFKLFCCFIVRTVYLSKSRYDL